MHKLFLVLLIVVPLLLVIPETVNAQQQSNLSTTQQIAPTPVLQAPTQTIATDQDVFNQFLTSLGITGGGIITGVGALWAKIRGKTKNIDQALRGSDFDNRDLLEVLNSYFEGAKKNPEMTPAQLLELPAYKDKVLLKKSIAEAWATEYDEYMEWFHQRYEVNKE